MRETHSTAAGLDYPGVGPEHAFLKESGRATYVNVTDLEAIDAFHQFARSEGIVPALESAHAIAFARKLAAQRGAGDLIFVNLSGRGDKDFDADERIAGAFERAKRERRIAFIPYVMAGDPDLETTEAFFASPGDAGADVVELGVPYSDPLADGPTIAAAGARALATGRTFRTFLLVRRSGTRRTCRCYFSHTSISSINSGSAASHRMPRAAGVAGAIVPDCSLEESLDLRLALQRHGLEMPMLVAPSTTRTRGANRGSFERIRLHRLTLGRTGAGTSPNFAPLRAQLAMMREITEKPLAVGFGIGRPEDIREVASLTDGVVVGSALIDSCAGRAETKPQRRVSAFVAPLIAATSHNALENCVIA